MDEKKTKQEVINCFSWVYVSMEVVTGKKKTSLIMAADQNSSLDMECTQVLCYVYSSASKLLSGFMIIINYTITRDQ